MSSALLISLSLFKIFTLLISDYVYHESSCSSWTLLAATFELEFLFVIAGLALMHA